MDKKNIVNLTVRVEPKLHKSLKRKLIDSDFKSLQEVMVYLYTKWLKE